MLHKCRWDVNFHLMGWNKSTLFSSAGQEQPGKPGSSLHCTMDPGYWVFSYKLTFENLATRVGGTTLLTGWRSRDLWGIWKYDWSLDYIIIIHCWWVTKTVKKRIWNSWSLTTITDLRLDKSKQQVHMKSKIQAEMFVTNMLTLLLLMIMYDITFFKPVYLETSLTVNLTILLVLTTIFTSEIEELPPTWQTKMIDIAHLQLGRWHR